MKKYVKEMNEGERVLTALLISNVNRGVTSSGAPYLSVTFSDKTGTIEGKMWDVKEEQAEVMKIGKIVNVEGDIYRYKNNLQMKVHIALPAQEYELSDFIMSSEVGIDVLKEYIYDTLASIRNKNIHLLVETVLQEHEMDFFRYPAASRNHHNYAGGLAEHVYGMLKVGKALCDIYPMLNRDLLLGGIIIHDVGKLQELSGSVATEYTTEGKLLGHISIMQAEVYETAKRLGIEESEEVLLLRHMVLSHHGAHEFGSPVLPETAEAEALTFIDNMDARMNMLNKAFADVKEGEFTGRIFALDNRSFYKHRVKSEN